MTKGSHPDVVVVGAGIVGSACARSLARRGLSVLLLDAEFAGGGVTSAGMGHLVVMDDSPAQFALTSFSRRLWEELSGELSAECENDPCGTLWIAADEEEMAAVFSKHEYYRQRGVETEILDAKSLAAAEPNLRPGLAGALRVPGDRVVYPPAAARWLAAGACEAGAQIRENAAAERIDERGVMLSGERIEAGAVVNAAGPHAPKLTPGLPISPRKGHLLITDRYPGFCRHQLVELGYLKSAHGSSGPSVAFNIQPRATGQMLLGSSREFVGWDYSVNRATLQKMIARGIDFMPRLSELSAIRAWTGFRPATPDKLPLIGRWGESGATWIAAGHEGLGITTALGTAELLASLITGESPEIDPAPFDPNRVMREETH